MTSLSSPAAASTAGAVPDGPTWSKQIRTDGSFERRNSVFRDWIRPNSEFEAEENRYHLYVSLACPWAHRTLLVRGLKGLAEQISYDVVDILLPHRGWTFTAKDLGATLDTVLGQSNLRAIYERVSPQYRGSVTVPTLWDKKRGTIVNNESSEIIRMFNGEFNDWARHPEVDLYPKELRPEIDSINEWVYPMINNGVYRSGFARSQEAYDEAVSGVFEGLDRCEELLKERRYLTGSRFTEADIRLWTTLIRFDPVYVGHFKCNRKRLVDYPNLWAYTRELFSHPVFRETTNFDHIVRHYYESHESINPHRIVPIGPAIDYDEPHGRDHLECSWFPQAPAQGDA